MAEPLGIYIHWPFCPRICPYCDFNVYKRKPIDETLWEQAYVLELERVYARVPDRELVSIYFGGGTPSLMPIRIINRIIEEATKLWPVSDSIEISIESNPTQSDADQFEAFKGVGINRLSLGIQSFDDDALEFLGRWHSAEEALSTFKKARNIFGNISFDLIYARPGQTKRDWETELSGALALEPDHLSLYQLTVEEGTAFEKAVGRGDWGELERDLAAELYELSQDICEAAGFPAYEISNHASSDYQSRHNLLYWRYKDYAGIGPGAHGRLCTENKKLATYAHKRPDNWLAAALGTEGGWAEQNILSPAQQAAERLLMGLRISEGVPLEAVTNETSIPDLIDHGLIELKSGCVAATPAGRLVLDALAERLSAS